jgi:hypothetical protein
LGSGQPQSSQTGGTSGHAFSYSRASGFVQYVAALYRNPHWTGSPIDGDKAVSFARFTIGGLQLQQMLDINMSEAKVNSPWRRPGRELAE